MSRNQSIRTTQSILIIFPKSEEQVDEKRVLLKIQGDAGQYYYWTGPSTRLAELLMDYTRRLAISINSVSFLYKHVDIFPYLSVPVYFLDPADGDSIDVIRKDEYDEHMVAKGSKTTLISLPRAEGERPICLQVECVGMDGNLAYLIGQKTPLVNAFRDYTDRTFQFYDCTKFLGTRIGSHLDPKKTADDLELEDGDIIRAETFFELPTITCAIL